MLELWHGGMSLLVQAILLAAALIDCGVLTYASTSAVAAFLLFAATSQADAETTEGLIVTDEVVADSEEPGQLWRQPPLANPTERHISPRLAFDDNLYVLPSLYPRLAQQPESTTDDSVLPILPAPSNSGAAASSNAAPSAEAPGSTEQPAEDKPTTELEQEFKKIEEDEKKKEEKKPAIPDLAKGILIASNDGDLTFKPGLRIQPRYEYEEGNDNNDFFIRRFRLKGSGSAYGVAKYGVELKIDNDGRFAATPSARVENAWLDFPLFTHTTDDVYLRAGLYDMPFSRDALTSDSKLLFMDRTLIKEEVTGVGMADNGIGVMLHGRPHGGYFEYAFGIFDNVTFERFGIAGTRESDQLMPVGRIVWSLLDPMTPPDGYADYQESYIGKGQRLELGANAAHMGEIIDGGAAFDLTAWGIDLFANSGHYTFQTEYDQILENVAGAVDIHSNGWYAQFGYLFDPCDPCVEFAVRYQELDPLVGDTLRWTSIGFNFYIREHNLKIQTDYTVRSEVDNPVIPGGISLFDEDVFEVQLQLDF